MTPLQDSAPSFGNTGFAEISAQLTGQEKLDPHLVPRCYRALCKVDARFEDKFLHLERAAQDFARPLMSHGGNLLRLILKRRKWPWRSSRPYISVIQAGPDRTVRKMMRNLSLMKMRSCTDQQSMRQ